MDLINWDLIPGFLIPQLVKENIVHKHPNDFPTGICLLKINEKALVQGVESVQI